MKDTREVAGEGLRTSRPRSLPILTPETSGVLLQVSEDPVGGDLQTQLLLLWSDRKHPPRT